MSDFDYVPFSGIEYPKEAFAPDGVLWWESSKRGATGAVPRMASWLRWNVEIGGRFTTRQLRETLGISNEHAQRRQRELRDYGWEYLSSKEEPSLGEDCILEKYGWWPGEGPRPRRQQISSKLRRQVFERDGGRCVLCGRAAGEKYDDGSVVTLTAGHIIANSHGGAASLDNLQTECRVCNESARADTGSVADPGAVVEQVKSLKKADRMELLSWIRAKQRSRSPLDRAFDAYRLGGPNVQAAVLDYLEKVESR
ncbi:HNH endonuclease [Corynebacterium phoceense]|uniref:HNH endonuclease n=1 Tax=Corynebacterium phoceense TaxID=1686286 RepID=UPI00211C9EE1|nr:HNH endonuclease [Corynebacterium phoceense]MCQ9330402.1 HNH endonuclease [Corynebacterium phoceense]MCQ9348403.1 HNH endonuclease [Corynebacterium phoceense]